MRLHARLPLAHLLTLALGACVPSGPAPSPTQAVLSDAIAIFEPGGRTFDVGVLPGQRASVAFTKPGTYAYHCGVHPQMRAVVRVCDGPCH